MVIVIATLKQSLFFTAKQLPYILVGLFLAEMIIALGWINRLTWLTKPMMRYGHLNPGCGIPFLMAFASPPAASSMLLGFEKENRITRKELVYAVLVNSFPSAIMHWRWWLPAILSVLGKVGFVYFILLVTAEMIRAVIFLTAARFSLPAPGGELTGKKKEEKTSFTEAAQKSLVATKDMTLKIMKLFIPVTLIIFLLANLGAFDALSNSLKGIAKYFPIPVEGLPIIAAQFGNSLVAFATAGNLYETGVVGAKDIVMTLFVGRIFSSIVLVLRMQIPMVVGIFGRQVGFRIIGARLVTSVVIDLMMVFLVYHFWWL